MRSSVSSSRFVRIIAAATWTVYICLVARRTTQAFTTVPSTRRIVVPTTIQSRTTKLGAAAIPFHQSIGFVISDGTTAGEQAIAEVASDAAAFSDQIDYLGDPTIRTLFLVFGGFIVVLGGLAVLSRKMDAAIENVLEDFESVMKKSPEFGERWEAIELELKVFDNEVEKVQKRKQRLFEIMEDMEAKEPALMKKVSAKMEQLNK